MERVAAEKLLDPGLAGRLEGYRLVRAHPVPGGYAGARRSPRKGGAVEFADYREYTAGDEPRRVDWKAYARLGRLYVKEYLDEKQDAVLFIVDTSASMDWGAGKEHKGRYALGLAAGLGTCVLAGNDRLAVVAGSGPVAGEESAGAEPGNPETEPVTDNPLHTRGEHPGTPAHETAGKVAARSHVTPPETVRRPLMQNLPPVEGRRSLPRLWHWLAGVTFAGGTDLACCLRQGLQILPGTTSMYVFSDLLDPAGVEEMLRQAAGRGIVTTLIHVLAPGELEPPGEGEWTMVDAENGERVEVSLTPVALADYAARLNEYVSSLDNSCRRWNARRVQISSGRLLEDALLRDLPGEGVIK